MNLKRISIIVCGVAISTVLSEADIKLVHGVDLHNDVEQMNVYPRPDIGGIVAGTTASGDMFASG